MPQSRSFIFLSVKQLSLLNHKKLKNQVATGVESNHNPKTVYPIINKVAGTCPKMARRKLDDIRDWSKCEIMTAPT